MPNYETVFMARQDLTQTQVKALTDGFAKIITDNGGKVHKTEQWGLLTLAYKINKAKKAHYVLIETDTPAPALHEMERNMRLNEDVMRYLTTRQEKLSEGPSIMMRKSDEQDDDEPKRFKKFDRDEEAA